MPWLCLCCPLPETASPQVVRPHIPACSAPKQVRQPVALRLDQSCTVHAESLSTMANSFFLSTARSLLIYVQPSDHLPAVKGTSAKIVIIGRCGGAPCLAFWRRSLKSSLCPSLAFIVLPGRALASGQAHATMAYVRDKSAFRGAPVASVNCTILPELSRSIRA